MKLRVGIRAEIKNEMRPWQILEMKMKCGPSINGIMRIQIWQRRIRGPNGPHTKNVYGFLHTRSFSSAFFNVRLCCAGRALRARSRL